MTWRHLALGAALMMALTAPVLTQNLPADLQRAKQREAATGDCKVVLPEYSRIAEQAAKSNRAATAEALLRAGMCHEALGDVQAKGFYTRAAEFKDQRTFADEASRRLQSLVGPRTGAGAMPPAGPFKTASPDVRLGFYSIRSRDGARVVESDNGNLTELDQRTGRSRVLVRRTDDAYVLFEPAWSPDGTKLAFSWTSSSGSSELRTLDLQSLAVRTVAGFPEEVTRVNWPSADRLIYALGRRGAKGRFSVVDIESGAVRSLFEVDAWRDADVGNPTPDGQGMVIVRSERLTYLDFETGAERSISLGVGASFPRISPDGQLIAYLARTDGGVALNVAPFDRRTTVRPVTVATFTRGGGRVFLEWTHRHGLELGYQDSQDDLFRAQVDIETMKVRNRPELLTLDVTGGNQASLSPDGKLVAFRVSPAAPQGGVGLMSSDGGQLRVTGRAGLHVLGWVSGESLLVRAPASDRLETLNILTGALAPIGQLAGVPNVVYYSAATREVLYSESERPHHLKRRFLADGAEQTLVAEDVNGFAVSPDGTYLAAIVRPDDLRIFRLNPDGLTLDRKVRVSNRVGWWITWTPDGRHLVLGGETPQAFRLSDGKSWPLFDLASFPTVGRDAEVWFGGDSQPRFASDGSFMVFGAGTQRTRRLAWEAVTYDAVTKLIEKVGGR